MNEDDILGRVTLLAILKKKSDESLNDVLDILADTGMYDKKEGRAVFRQLTSSGHIVGNGLSITGISIAKRAEQDFKQ